LIPVGAIGVYNPLQNATYIYHCKYKTRYFKCSKGESKRVLNATTLRTRYNLFYLGTYVGLCMLKSQLIEGTLFDMNFDDPTFSKICSRNVIKLLIGSHNNFFLTHFIKI